MRILYPLFFLVFTSTYAVAQSTAQKSRSRIVTQTANGRTIPDPKNLLSIAPFLVNSTIAKELRLDVEQLVEVRKLLEESRGALSVGIISGELAKKMTRDELQVHFGKERLQRTALLQAIVDPIQLNRLKEIVYQVEVARVGIGESLINGFLGNDVGVEEYQKGPLRLVSDAIERRLGESTWKVKITVADEFLEVLSPSQRHLVVERLGPGFQFKEEPSAHVFEHRLLSPSVNRYAIPDPNSLVAVIGVAMNKSVLEGLTLTQDQRDAIRQLHKETKGSLVSRLQIGTNGDELRSRLGELLGPSDQKRLSQMAYQIEISRVGLAVAIANGYLGKDVNIDKSQLTKMESITGELQEKQSKAILELQAAAFEDVLRELTPLQKDHAHRLLGKPFLYTEDVVSP